MGANSNDRWTEETVPSRRVRPDDGDWEDSAPSGVRSIPISVWLLGIVVVLLTLTVCGLWALYTLRGTWTVSGSTPTPIIWTPTPVPIPTAGPTPPPPPPAEETETVPTASPDIAIGRYVRVVGTEDVGLSLRSGPGANYQRMDVALEGEVFIVVEGPTVTAGSEWWKIRDPKNQKRDWWAIGNYLEPVDQP